MEKNISRILTDNDPEGTERERLGLHPEQRGLEHSDGHDHRVGGLVVVGVHRGDVGHVGKVVPPAPRVRAEELLDLSKICD